MGRVGLWWMIVFGIYTERDGHTSLRILLRSRRYGCRLAVGWCGAV
jgi:hypothetical protein